MPQIHDTNNYTVPGGIKLFFTPTGGVEKDLGNMVDVSIGRETENLEHFTNRPGTRVKDKVIALSESITIDFSLDEPVISNFILFFKGDAAATQGDGTAAIVDQKVSLAASYGMTSLGKPGAITSYSARQFLDYVYLYDGVSAYANHSVEADTAAGTPFTAMADNNDKLYCGKKTKFQEVRIEVNVAHSGYTAVTWEYWNGSAWTTLSTAGTADFSADATFTFTVPGSWALTTVNGISAYWIRAQQTAASPATPATIDNIGRQALVENTDYVVDLGTSSANAAIRAVAAASLVDGEEIKVSFTYPTFASVVSNLVKAGAAEGAARLEVHPQSGRGLSFDIEIP
ncbi:MAG: hypothetical protein OEV56_06320, partial [Dehalococcoidia bacterium]|nr:hypothetical protein [Dehalococcoidia bacterium]